MICGWSQLTVVDTAQTAPQSVPVSSSRRHLVQVSLASAQPWYWNAHSPGGRRDDKGLAEAKGLDKICHVSAHTRPSQCESALTGRGCVGGRLPSSSWTGISLVSLQSDKLLLPGREKTGLARGQVPSRGQQEKSEREFAPCLP